MTLRSVGSLALVLALFGLAPSACKDDGSESGSVAPESDAGTDDAGLKLTFGEPPIADLPQGVRFAGAVPYGTDSMQVVDVFLPPGTTPTAAVLFYHGGGFTKGSRADAYKYKETTDGVRKVLAAGIAWIGVEYRLLEPAGTEKEGVLKSLRDCQRAIQFVRHHAGALNIDPKRIGANGSSAGAGASMWLAFHDEMAKADSADPIERESTRPQAVAVEAPQSTYDVFRWAKDILAPEYSYVTDALFLEQDALRSMIVQFYGLDAAAGADGATLLAATSTPDMVAYRTDVDMLAQLSSDDAPTYLVSASPNVGPLESGFDLLHHPLHGKAVYARGAEVGARVEANIPSLQITAATSSYDFLLDRLKP